MSRYAEIVGNPTQAEPLPGRNMVQNSDGAFVFGVDDWGRLDRFLILGADGPTYYATHREFVRENAAVVERCVQQDPARAVLKIVATSMQGAAPSNDPALFALALAIKTTIEPKAKQLAMDNLPRVARTGSHLLTFVRFCDQLGVGWGRKFKRGVADWFREHRDVEYQILKYGQRNGWSMRDVLRLAHPLFVIYTPGYAAVRWAVKGEAVGPKFEAIEKLKTVKGKEAAELIRSWRLPHEAVPNELKNDVEVWAALFDVMPLWAMVRNLAKMTNVGFLKPLSDAANVVVQRLGDSEHIRTARIHPIGVLKALRTYQQGHGEKGKLAWVPVATVCTALDRAFYLAFDNVPPTNKRHLVCLDISGSMSMMSPGLGMTPREISAAMAMVVAHTEPQHAFVGFHHDIIPLSIRKGQPLKDVVRYINGLGFGNTACEKPMLFAKREKLNVDAFVMWTDSETNNMHSVHPARALQEYRQSSGINAKMAVCAATSNGFSIADPQDGGMLDIVGFSTDVPAVLANFIGGPKEDIAPVEDVA